MPGNWHHIPVLRLLLPFVLGILLGMRGPHPPDASLIICTALTICCMAAMRKRAWVKRYRYQWIFGLALQLLLILCGYTLLHYKTPIRHSGYFMHDADSTAVFFCRVKNVPFRGERSTRIDLEVLARHQHNGMAAVEGVAIMYLKNTADASIGLQYGDELWVRNIFITPEPPKNPGAFDYGKYLASTGIFHIAYADSADFLPANSASPKKAWQLIFAARAYFHRAMQTYVHDPDAQTVGEALVIGSRTDISDEVKHAYARTGTMHILAVSGLHVGILFAVLEFLLRPVIWFNKNKYGKYVKCILLLLIIWWYACLSGLSPSVNRSAVMFSFMTLGKLFERQNNTFNILFVSMFVLLIDDPWCITQVGFQLSYLAVAGIVFFQPYGEKLWRPKQWVIRYVWTLITVSVAAQLATVPITLYYFHQFPNYFLLSNLIAIPVSFVVLILGLLFFCTGAVSFIAPVTGFLLDRSLQILNASVVWVEQLPHAVLDNICIQPIEVLCLYMILLCIGIFLVTHHTHWLRWVWAGMICCALSISVRQFRNMHTNRLSIYQVKGSNVLMHQSGRNAVLLSDTLPFAGSDPYLFSLRNDLLTNGALPDREIDLTDTSVMHTGAMAMQFPWLVAGEHVVFLLSPTSVHQLPSAAPEVDVLYILDNPFLNLPDLRSRFPGATLVVGGTSIWRRHNYYMSAGEKAGFTVWSIPVQGAFILDT